MGSLTTGHTSEHRLGPRDTIAFSWDCCHVHRAPIVVHAALQPGPWCGIVTKDVQNLACQDMNLRHKWHECLPVYVNGSKCVASVITSISPCCVPVCRWLCDIDYRNISTFK
jgi:hypothetical protein